MKRIAIIVLIALFCSSIVLAKDVYVRGYYRKDGTYVRPHHRSSPDSTTANNYGRPSYRQRKQYQHYQELPSYTYDYDSDGITNQYDYDDDNDGISDVYDSNQYNKQSSSFYQSTFDSYGGYDSDSGYGYDSDWGDSGDDYGW